MADPLALAEKIAQKVQGALEPLRLEMALNKWPAEFREIMWRAVADISLALANEAKTEQPRPTRSLSDG